MSQGFSLSDKQARMQSTGANPVISSRTYNLVIGLVVVYGVLVNALICSYLAPVFYSMNALALIVGYFVMCLLGSYITYKSKSPVVSFVGYNLVVLPVGAVLSVLVQAYSTAVVTQAFFLTTVITGVMLIAATLFPGTFAGMGRMLFVGLVGVCIAQLICVIFNIYVVAISWICAAIFSLYIGYDWVKAQMYVPTLDNAVDSALDIYLDIINLFVHLLAILGRRDE